MTMRLMLAFTASWVSVAIGAGLDEWQTALMPAWWPWFMRFAWWTAVGTSMMLAWKVGGLIADWLLERRRGRDS